MLTAIYPGSFDPITYGHLDIALRAKKLFDRFIVAIVENPNKQPLFTASQRQQITCDALAEVGIEDVEVIIYSGLLIECAKMYEAHAIVRGLRANSDFEYEFQMSLANRTLNSGIESVFFMTAGKYSFLSSGIVKEIQRYGGVVSPFVPSSVERALEEQKSRGSQLKL